MSVPVDAAPSILFLFLRRMRAPLIVLIASYTISIVGLVMMPGVDSNGAPWRMSIFHAFYFVTYTATTIGFGEIPHPFSEAQRLWVTVSVYLTVVAWFYAIGKLFALFQDAAFQRVIAVARFERGVRAIREPFALVVGYGETGKLLVDALDRRGLRSVVLDLDESRVAEIELGHFRQGVPAVASDARRPRVLENAGLASSYCHAVAAVTADETVNLAVSITAKLERPRLPVIARCSTTAMAENLGSFGTDFVLNPMDLFAWRLGLALRAPSVFLLGEWLASVPGAPLREPVSPPRGLWVVCGYGRFGRAVIRELEANGCEAQVIEPHPTPPERPGLVEGDGTGAKTLEAARIREAVGLIAGTPNDANNFSIIMTAKALNPKLFVVLRQNRDYNSPLVGHLKPDLVMEPSRMIARAALAVLTMPLLVRFLQSVDRRKEDWANELIARIAGVSSEVVPDVWTVSVTPTGGPGAWQEAAADRFTLTHLLANPWDRNERVDAVPLLLLRGDQETLLPEDDLRIHGGDQLLFCGSPAARRTMTLIANNRNVAHYVAAGEEPQAVLWRWIAARTKGA